MSKKTYQKVTLANQMYGVHQTNAAALGLKIPVPIFIVATVLSNMAATDVVQMECGKIGLFILILFISIGIIKSCIICFHILTTFFYLFCQLPKTSTSVLSNILRIHFFLILNIIVTLALL